MLTKYSGVGKYVSGMYLSSFQMSSVDSDGRRPQVPRKAVYEKNFCVHIKEHTLKCRYIKSMLNLHTLICLLIPFKNFGLIRYLFTFSKVLEKSCSFAQNSTKLNITKLVKLTNSSPLTFYISNL